MSLGMSLNNKGETYPRLPAHIDENDIQDGYVLPTKYLPCESSAFEVKRHDSQPRSPPVFASRVVSSNVKRGSCGYG